jgi:hypothetical protein
MGCCLSLIENSDGGSTIQRVVESDFKNNAGMGLVNASVNIDNTLMTVAKATHNNNT